MAERLVKELNTKNIKLVLNVTPDLDAYFVQLAVEAGITYSQMPMLDSSYVPSGDVQRIVHRVVEEVTRGNGVMIHCNQALNRSPLIAILAIIRLTGDEPTEAIRRAREIRPASPIGHAGRRETVSLPGSHGQISSSGAVLMDCQSGSFSSFRSIIASRIGCWSCFSDVYLSDLCNWRAFG